MFLKLMCFKYFILVYYMKSEEEIKERIKICQNTLKFISKDQKKKMEGEIEALKWVLSEN